MIWKKKKQIFHTGASIIMAVAMLAIFAGCSPEAETQQSEGASESQVSASVEGGNDIVIEIDDITDKARFYSAEADGTKLEVLAVKAPDGTIRTAFNTCQVCYDSGRGYYKQENNMLVCQNCGNRFSMDRVEVESGGCNPVPIFPENKTITDNTITISSSFLKEAKAIFENWKTEY